MSNTKFNAGIQANVVNAIGCTPLVALDRITADVDGRILAKLDMLNPGFSKKDRVARQIIDDAEADGALTPGQPVLELTSGNMGTGLAIVCAVRSYPFIAVMSKGNSEERARMMRALGAEVVLVDQTPDSCPGHVSGADLELVEQEAQRLTVERGAFRADQFQLQGNFRAHYLTTGPEIWAQSEGQINAFCDFVGSGGTYGGCASYLKEQNAAVQCFIVEPAGASVLSGETLTEADHPIQGGGYAMQQLIHLKDVPVDGYVSVSGEEATACARRLAKEEGIFAGFSSGANLAAALQLLSGSLAGATIGIVICDSGLKYLTTELWP